jgi:hypothetical protein
MKHMASAKKSSRSKTPKPRWPRFVMCVDNAGYLASLEVGKMYRQIKPHANDMRGWIRVVDESGEDYLFPERRFVAVDLPPRARRAIAVAG